MMMWNGTVGITLTPVAFLSRLASIVPPSRSHDTCYFGVFASHSARRGRLVKPVEEKNPSGPMPCGDEYLPAAGDPLEGDEICPDTEPTGSYIPWAQLMKKSFGIEVDHCRCGGTLRVVDYVTEPARISRVLDGLGIGHQTPVVARARPGPDGADPPPGFAAPVS